MSSVDESVTTDVKFAQVPHWVLELPLSDKAIRLYAILSKYADNSDGTSYPGRGTLAKYMRCHRSSVDRAVEELIEAGCITKQVRYREGRFTSSLYTVIRIPPSRTDEGSRTNDATPRRTDETTSSHPCDIELEPQNVEPEELVAAAPQEASAKKKDELFEAVARACGIDWTSLTPSGRGPLNRAVKELKDVGATPDDVKQRATRYKQVYPDVALTPMALTKHWAALSTSKPKPDKKPSCQYCDQPLDDHDQKVCEAFGRFF